MAKFNQERIYEELDKLQDTDELHSAYLKIKDFVTKKLIAKQVELDEKSSELQSKIEKL